MDTDVRYVDVDKDLHLPLSIPHSRNESSQGPSLYCESDALPLECDSYAPVDSTMYSCESNMGLHRQREMFHESSATRNYLGSGQ